MGRTGRARAADVAELAGVSQATVSYVLNNAPGQTIPESTRLRVLEAAQSLGYVPHATAAALARGSSDIVIIDLSDVPYGSLVGAMSSSLADVVQQAGLVPIVEFGKPDCDAHVHLITLARTIRPRVVITMTPVNDATWAQLQALGVAVAMSVSAEGNDPLQLMREAAGVQVRHLQALGHRHIAYAPADEDSLHSVDAVRWNAVVDACTTAGIDVHRLSGAPDLDSARAAVLHAHTSGATAIVAYNDDVALALLAGAHAAQVSVPQQLSIIGVDDVRHAQFTIPALTTVTHLVRNFAPQVAIPALLGKKGVVSLSRGRIKAEVVERASTAPVADRT